MYHLADMKAMPQKTALTDCLCPAYSNASGIISWRVKKAITPPTVIIIIAEQSTNIYQSSQEQIMNSANKPDASKPSRISGFRLVGNRQATEKKKRNNLSKKNRLIWCKEIEAWDLYYLQQ